MKGLHLFAGYGLEMEYMIVDAATLDVLPVADEVLRTQSGTLDWTDEVTVGPLRWSNELVLHVIELKTNGPAYRLAGLAEEFTRHIGRINDHLGMFGGCLLPGAVHPWMDPHTQSRLWPHGNREIYRTYDRIFDCRGHGWSNLQSLHLNLPFDGDEEFGQLLAAIRLLLPILPALAASSPVLDGRITGARDTRLLIYKNNQKRIPSIAGSVIPEDTFSINTYREQVLAPMYRDISPLDPEGILQEEWLNSRGAIARFERNTIEIRLIDVQESPLADLAITHAVVAVLKALVAEQLSAANRQRSIATEKLAKVLEACIRDGEQAVIADPEYLVALGLPQASLSAAEVWQGLVEKTGAAACEDATVADALQQLLRQGTLARRLLLALGEDPAKERMLEVYRELCSCLATGRLFLP